jgi:hypothetical protein
MPEVGFGGAFWLAARRLFARGPAWWMIRVDSCHQQWLRLRQRVRTSNDIWPGRKSFANGGRIARSQKEQRAAGTTLKIHVCELKQGN